MRSFSLPTLAGLGGVVLAAAAVRADAFSKYALERSFQLPGGASSFDVLADGRIVTMVDAQVFVETGVASGLFASLGTLPGADLSPGPYATAFIRVSPDGTRIAVGNNGGVTFGNYQVGVFELGGLTGDWFAAGHYDAAWIDNRHVALTAGVFGQPSMVTALDTFSAPAGPDNPSLVSNIGGASGGITFDASGNLYTGNAFDGAGVSGTGWIKAFSQSAWQAALSGGAAVDFEAAGTLVVDVLSASALGFDAEGNLHVGGSDLFGGGEGDFAALVRSSAVLAALGGGGPADVGDPQEVRQFDPDSANDFNLYDVNYNDVTGELYFREGGTVYSFIVPEPAALVLIAIGWCCTAPRRQWQRDMA